jgi:hypothetical protein
LTFEKQFSTSGVYRLVLRDFSTEGTIVRFNKDAVKKKDWRWILDWPPWADRNIDIFLEITPSLRFHLVLGVTAESYITRVKRFLKDTESPEEIMMKLHLDTIRDNTSLPDAQARLVPSNPVAFRINKLAHSPYAHYVFSQLFDIETGASYAGKEIIPHERESRARAEELDKIERALGTVKNARHVRTPPLATPKNIANELSPQPRMLEYMHYTQSSAKGMMLVTELCPLGNILQTAI